MGMWDRVRGVFESSEKRNTRAPYEFGLEGEVSPAGGFATGLMRQSAPMRRGAEEGLLAYRDGPWVRATMAVIGNGIGSLTWRVWRARQQTDEATDLALSIARTRDPVRRRLEVARAIARSDYVEVPNHPLLKLLERPNPLQSGRRWFRVLQTHLDMTGDAFVVMDVDPVSWTPRALWPLPPTWVSELPTSRSPEYVIRDATGAQMRIPAELVLRLSDLDPADVYGRGAGLGMTLSDEIDVDENAAKTLSAWFANRAMPDLLISVKGAKREVLEAARRRWENALRGFRKAFRTHWTGGEIQVERLDTSFREMAMVDIRKFERDTIVSVTGVPPEKVGILTSSNRATIEAADLFFSKDVIVPRAEEWRESMQHGLVPLWGEGLFLDYDSPVPMDREYALRVMASQPAAFPLDEYRALLGVDPLSSGAGAGVVVPAGVKYYADVRDIAPDPVVPMGFSTEPKRLAAATDGPRPKARALRQSDVRSIISAVLAEDLGTEVEPVVESLADHFAQEMADQLGSERDPDDPELRKRAKEWTKERAAKLIDETTKRQLSDKLTRVIADGGTDEDVVGAVNEVFDSALVERSQFIAENESKRESEWAGLHEIQRSGLTVEREWVSTFDGRARDEHMALDGTVVGSDEPFTVTGGQWKGAKAMHPGGFGIGALDINCRCVVVPRVLDDDDEEAAARGEKPAEQREAMWRAIDKKVRVWEHRFEDALAKGWQRQREAVLARVKEVSK